MLTKRVERFRATLPGHVDAVGNGDAGIEIWIHLGCRARDPAEAPTVWINLSDHPEQPPAPHWATDPIDFAFTLVRHGEFETTPVEMRTEGVEARAKVIRRRVIAWTESSRPWPSIEFESPKRSASALLDMIAGEAGPETITLNGASTRIELHPEWSAADRALATQSHRGRNVAIVALANKIARNAWAVPRPWRPEARGRVRTLSASVRSGNPSSLRMHADSKLGAFRRGDGGNARTKLPCRRASVTHQRSRA